MCTDTRGKGGVTMITHELIFLVTLSGTILYSIVSKNGKNPLRKTVLIVLWCICFGLLCIVSYRVYWMIVVSGSGCVPF